MAASPVDTLCSAQTNSRCGMTQLVIPMTRKCSHTTGSRGSRCRPMIMITPSVSAPRISRDQATWVKETPSSATFMNRKLAPQIRAIPRNCATTTDWRGGADLSLTNRHYRRRPTPERQSYAAGVR